MNNQNFNENNIEKYFEVLSKDLSKYGYMCVQKTYGIWVFPKGISKRGQTLKHLVCAIYGKTENHIDWGPNYSLKSKLENLIIESIQSIDN